MHGKTTMSNGILNVAVGLIIQDGKILLGKRVNGHYAGFWEFPGGKQEQNESIKDTLYREMKEELDISVTQAKEILNIRSENPNTTLHLAIWMVSHYNDMIIANEQQCLQWVCIKDLKKTSIIPTNQPIIEYLTQGIR